MRELANKITVGIQAIHSDALFAPLIQCAAPGHSSISNTSNARSQDEPTAASAALRATREAAICQGEPMIPILQKHINRLSEAKLSSLSSQTSSMYLDARTKTSFLQFASVSPSTW